MLAISNPQTIDEVVFKFFVKNLPKISGVSDYEYINEMIQSIYANAATLQTTISGGKHGHIFLIMNYALYATLIMGTPWEDSKDRG